MKTTAEDKIKLYVLTHINMSEQSMQLQEVGTYKGLLRELMRKFRSYARERRSLGFSEKECFDSFAGGLPSFFTVDFETYRQKELLEEWMIYCSRDENISKLFYGKLYEVIKKWEDKEWE